MEEGEEETCTCRVDGMVEGVVEGVVDILGGGVVDALGGVVDILGGEVDAPDGVVDNVVDAPGGAVEAPGGVVDSMASPEEEESSTCKASLVVVEGMHTDSSPRFLMAS